MRRALPPGVVDGVLPGEDDLGDRDKGVALLEQSLDDSRQGLRGMEGGVVEQDNGPRLYLDIDHLIPFCEYIYDFVLRFGGHYFFVQINKHFYLQQINKVIEAIGYIESREDESSTVKTRVMYPLPRPGIRKHENKKETLYYKTNFERRRPSGAEQTFSFGRSHSIFVQIRHK